MPIVVIVAIILICAIISIIWDKLDDWFFKHSIFFQSLGQFIGDNFFLFCAVMFLVLAGCAFVYFKPHPAAKHFNALTKEEITRQVAIEKICDTVFNHRRDKIPSPRESKSIHRRIWWLRKRVKAEEDLINDLISYMKTKARIE